MDYILTGTSERITVLDDTLGNQNPIGTFDYDGFVKWLTDTCNSVPRNERLTIYDSEGETYIINRTSDSYVEQTLEMQMWDDRPGVLPDRR